MLEVAIHGLSEGPDEAAGRARQALANVFAPMFEDDLVVEVVEHAGGTCSQCPHDEDGMPIDPAAAHAAVIASIPGDVGQIVGPPIRGTNDTVNSGPARRRRRPPDGE
jgi:hypothetical protein